MDWKDDASRQVDKMKNNAEIGAEKVKKGFDNMKHDANMKWNDDKNDTSERLEKAADNAKHDAKINMKEGEEKLQQEAHDFRKSQENKEDNKY